MPSIVEKSKGLMRKQTLKNKSPAWLLTELAVSKGRELARIHDADEDLVLASLYLAHTVFDRDIDGHIQKNHPNLSSDFIRGYLDEWKLSKKEKDIIINSIEAHHGKVPTKSLVAEVVKNAECFKFVTMKGALILLHEMGIRGMPFEESVRYVLKKMKDKQRLLTLEDCKKEAEVNCREIEKLFGQFTRNY